MQLALVALPQLPLLLHWNVADPLRQDAVSDRVTAVPAGVRPTPEEQLLPQDSVVSGQFSHVQDRGSLARGLVDSGQAAPPQPGWMQVTSRLRVCVQPSPDGRQSLQSPHSPVCQTPSLGSFPVQSRDGRPEQLPPHPGRGLVHVRVCVPLAPQALAEQALQSDQPPSLGLLPVQACENAPEQLLPPQPGDGRLHVRVCVPLAPQAVAEQLLHADQPPSLGLLPVQDCEDAPEQLLPPQPGDGKLHVRVCVPLAPQALAEQLLQAVHPPGLGSLPVQEREDAPTQALPPQAGDGWVQARVCVPPTPQALAEQALHADQPPSTGSFAVQERDDGPLQALPPQPGDGLSQVRVWVPVAPQPAAEQLPHADQPPSTGALPVQARVSLVPRAPSSFRHS